MSLLAHHATQKPVVSPAMRSFEAQWQSPQQKEEARAAYSRALDLTRPGPERRFLESRIDRLSEASCGDGGAR